MSTLRADVAVVGAGPAGMAAALAAADLGAQVVLIDAGRSMGGQIYRRPATASAAAVTPVGPKMPQRLRRLEGRAGVRHLSGVLVWQAARVTAEAAEVYEGIGADGVRGDIKGFVARGGSGAGGEDGTGAAEFWLWLTPVGGDGAAGVQPDRVVARAVVVATGTNEVVVPFPGWELPGVSTVGAAQALLKGQGVFAGRRVLVAGSGPLLLPAAAGLAEAGVRVMGVLEANPVTVGTLTAAARVAPFTRKAREAASYGRILGRHRVPVKAGYAVVAAHGDERVTEATVSRVDRDWRAIRGTERRVRVDAVHASFGFSPALELSRALGCADLPQPGRPVAAVWCDGDQATSVPGVFAAGETTGVAGADVAELEGYLAGAASARYVAKSGHAAFHISNQLRAGRGELDLSRLTGGAGAGAAVRARAGRAVSVAFGVAGLGGGGHGGVPVRGGAVGGDRGGGRGRCPGRARGQGRDPVRHGLLPGPDVRARGAAGGGRGHRAGAGRRG